MASRFVKIGAHELHYMEFLPAGADPAAAAALPLVIAWHGLARTCRDFDDVAASLAAAGFRICCPDTPGRGLSSWAADPVAEYNFSSYERITLELLEHLGGGPAGVYWLGTSMGGALGLRLAAGPLKEKIRGLLLNDIGPELEAAAVARIATYVGSPPAFPCFSELFAYMRAVYRPFGPMPEATWQRLAHAGARRLADGQWTFHYDGRIAVHLTHSGADYDLWPCWEGLRERLPVLLVRGASSDLLSPRIVEAMRGRGAVGRSMRLVEVPGCGHAPSLAAPEQVAFVTEFFEAARAGAEADAAEGTSAPGGAGALAE